RAWRCRDGQVVVVNGQLDDNEGVSVTNAAERLIEHAIATYGENVIVVEHYPRGLAGEPSFDQVVWAPEAVERDDDGEVAAIRSAGWVYRGEAGMADLLDGHLPRVWPAGTYLADAVGSDG